MNRHRILLACSLLGLSVAAFTCSAGAASHDEQKKACRGDAVHFCSADIPNREKIIECLKEHLSELKPKCRAMFEDDQDTTSPESSGS